MAQDLRELARNAFPPSEEQRAFLNALWKLWEDHFKDIHNPSFVELVNALNKVELNEKQLTTIFDNANDCAKRVWGNDEILGATQSDRMANTVREPLSKLASFSTIGMRNGALVPYAAEHSVIILEAQTHNIKVFLKDDISKAIQKIIDDENEVAKIARSMLPENHTYPKEIKGMDHINPLPENF